MIRVSETGLPTKLESPGRPQIPLRLLTVRLLLLASAMQHARNQNSVASGAVVDDVFPDRKLSRPSINVVCRHANAGSRGKRPELFMQQVKEPIGGRFVVGGDLFPDVDHIPIRFRRYAVPGHLRPRPWLALGRRQFFLCAIAGTVKIRLQPIIAVDVGIFAALDRRIPFAHSGGRVSGVAHRRQRMTIFPRGFDFLHVPDSIAHHFARVGVVPAFTLLRINRAIFGGREMFICSMGIRGLPSCCYLLPTIDRQWETVKS